MTALDVIPRIEIDAGDDEFSGAIILNLQRSGWLTLAGLQIDDPDLPFETLEAIGRAFGQVRDMTAFALGDLILFGDAVHGELAAQLVESTGRSKSTLQNYVRVCVRVPFSRRRVPELTWSHHEAVASLEPGDQDRLLQLAIDNAWDVEVIRAERKAMHDGESSEQQIIDEFDRVNVVAAAKAVVSKARRVPGGYLIGVRAYESLRDAVDREQDDEP